MRFVWAVVAFVVAAVLIGAGIAQRTVFIGPDTATVAVDAPQQAPFVLIDGDVFRENPGAQTLLVRGDGDIFAAYGRTADMQAWLSDTDYNHVSVGDEGALDVEFLAAPAAEDAEGDQTTDDGEAGADAAVVRSPVGSDLWLDSFADTDTLIADMQLPDGMSLLIAKDGAQDAPADISISWPLDNSTPMAGPLMVAGALALLIGLVLYALGIRHQRRGRGPRRKGPGPLPMTEPIQLAAVPAAEREAIDQTAPGDGDTPTSSPGAEGADDAASDTAPRPAPMSQAPVRKRLRMLALPVIALTAVIATGCSAESWPRLDEGTPSPSPSATVIAPDNQKPPAVTESQAKRILQDVATTLTDADAAMDIELAATRLDGPALAARTTEYALRTAIPETPVPAAIPTDDVEVVLPEATDRWPRTVLLLSKSDGDDTVPPVVLTMTQQDPWSKYKVAYLAEMSADAVFPDVAASWLGTSLVPDDSAFLSMPPGDIAEVFSDVVDAGEASASYDLFDPLAIAFATAVADSRQVVVQNLSDNGAAETSATAFDMTPSGAAPVSMTTLGSGAIVSVSLVDTQSVTPTVEGAAIRFEGNVQAKALTGVTESAKGVTTKYEFQLFFAVPAQGSTEQIRLLAVRQDLLSVEVIK